MGWNGEERRTGYVTLDDQLLSAIRGAVRAELADAARDGRILSDEDRRAVTDWIDSRRRWLQLRDRVVQNTLGWLVVAVIGGVGLAVWEWVKRHIHQP